MDRRLALAAFTKKETQHEKPFGLNVQPMALYRLFGE